MSGGAINQELANQLKQANANLDRLNINAKIKQSQIKDALAFRVKDLAVKEVFRRIIMSDFLKFLEGKKTYIIAFIVGAVAALQYAGVEIPEWAYALLGALGLGSLRAGVNKAVKIILLCGLLFVVGCGNVWMSSEYKKAVTQADLVATELLKRCEAGDCEACKMGLQGTVETLDLILAGANGTDPNSK